MNVRREPLKRRRKPKGIARGLAHCLAYATCLSALTFIACEPTHAPEAGDGIQVREVLYRSEWDWQGVSVLSDGGWSTHNELGYEIRLRHGYMIQYWAQLTECPEVLAASDLNPFALSVAYAGHGDDTNVTTAPRARVLDLVQAEDLTWAQVELNELESAGTWCGTHQLVARVLDPDTTDALPASPDLNDISLYLAGEYRSAGATEWTPFEVDTAASFGALQELEEVLLLPLPDPLPTQRATLTLRRALVDVFAGVDFEAATDLSLDVTTQVLRNLVEKTETTLLLE